MTKEFIKMRYGYKYHGNDTDWMRLSKRYPVKSPMLAASEKRTWRFWLLFALGCYGVLWLVSRLPV
jgi:hypothetical protein